MSPQHAASDPIQGEGDIRSAALMWNIRNQYWNQKNQVPFLVQLDRGLLLEEMVNFTRITPQPLKLAIEDYDPTQSLNEDYIWSDESTYMAFYINGTEPVRLDGFWVYLRGETKGIMRFCVYGSVAGTEASTFPNLFEPFTDWIEVPISPALEFGQERWIWLDSDEEEVILDPMDTYANTFYIRIARAYSDDTRIRWVFCNDNSAPDNEDEGDCYGYMNGWTYRTRDMFLNVSILPVNRNPAPSEISMEINGEVVSDMPLPSRGLWESGLLDPPINVADSTRYYNVSITWLHFYQWEIEYDAIWSGSFFEPTPVVSMFRIEEERAGVNWTLLLIADYPLNVENQSLQMKMGRQWTVNSIKRNTLPYNLWSLENDELLIEDAEDGLWQLDCFGPNYVTNLEVRDPANRIITETNFTSLVKIRAYIKEPDGINVTNGLAHLRIYNPENTLIYNLTGLHIDNPAGGVVEIEWNIAATVFLGGYHMIEFNWANGTEAGSRMAILLITRPLSPFILFTAFLPWLILIIIILCSFFFFYRQRVLIPQQRIEEEYLQGLADTFSDVEKIRRILIIHKESGLCLLDPIVDEKMEANLLGGLIQAVTSFGITFNETTSGENEEEDITSPLQEITYRNFHITVQDGTFIRIAIICSSSPSNQLTKHLADFTRHFEDQYRRHLDGWKGRMDVFKDAFPLVDDSFKISLRFPHSLEDERVKQYSLSDSEQASYRLTKKILSTQGVIHLRDIVNGSKRENSSELKKAFKAIFGLKEKGILVPIKVKIPYTFSK